MSLSTLNLSKSALLIVDMQEKIFDKVDRGCEILNTMLKLIMGCQLLEVPIIVTEQYPEGLGQTLLPLRQLLGEQYQPWTKTTFSALADASFLSHFQSLPYTQWIVVGIEAHICVLQTVKHLLQFGKEVVVLNDVMTSRSIYDFSTAVAEMRDYKARISCAETVLFELVKNATHPQFKSISQLVKSCCPC